MNYAEYGARVKLDERYGYPTIGGTIVGYVELWDATGDECEIVYTIRRDFDGQECNYVPEQFTVSLAPSDAAHRMVERWSVDRALGAMEEIAAIGTSANLSTYQSAFIFALYRIHHYQSRPIVVLDADRAEVTFLYADNGHDRECVCVDCDPPGDDGYGYPVYSVED
jgi:hypothetical protein